MFVIGIQNRASDGGIICYANLIINCIAEHMFIQINSRLIHIYIWNISDPIRLSSEMLKSRPQDAGPCSSLSIYRG